MTWLLSFVLRPVILIVLFVVVLYPARRLVERRMHPGRLKRLLLTRIS